MNTEAEFRQAIAGDPKDELLYEAFADSLEERGDPRAAYVRNPQVRPWMGAKFEDPIPRLIKLLRSQRQIKAVRQAFALIGPPAVRELVKLLASEEPGVPYRVVQALSHMGE